MHVSDGSPQQCAEQFAKRGWPVIPLHYPVGPHICSCRKSDCSSAGKHPMTKNGLKNASSGPATILNWWRDSPKANVGILTGVESGLLVLDVDPRHGGEASLKALEQEFGSLPKTLTVKTGGDGWHFYFRHPGGRIPNRTSFRPGLDLRGDGGYIVAPPSTHASLKSYQWLQADQEVADLPAWLKQAITGLGAKQVSAPLDQESTSGFPEGSRKVSLLSVGGFLKSKGLDQDRIAKALTTLNDNLCVPPLPASDIQDLLKSIGRYEEKSWDEPTDLPPAPVAPELAVDMLPRALQDWCADIADRMQVPLEFTAGPAVAAIASLMGRKVAIYPKKRDDWHIIPNLWGCLIAPPGSMKSPAMSAVLKPINNLAVRARAEFLDATKKMEAEKAVAKTEIDALKDSLKVAIKQGKQHIVVEKKDLLAKAIATFEEDFSITERRYMMNDPTIEKFLAILTENPQGLLLYRDELSGWIETMYKSGREGDREFFLEAWNGDTPYSMDRIGRGSVFVDGLCLSVLGGLQPTKFQTYVAALVKGGKSDDGLLQRFQILLYPERKASWRRVDREPNSDAAALVNQICEKIANLPMPERQEGSVRRLSVRFNGAAQDVFDDWRENLEMRLASGTISPVLESHLSKYRSLMPKLALVFEAVEALGAGRSFPVEIESKATGLAIAWCEFLEQHARKSYGEFLEPEVAAGRRLLARIEAGAVKDYDRCRDIYRHGWKGLANQEELDAGIKALEKHGWVRTEVLAPPTGRRFEVIRLHPSLRMA